MTRGERQVKAARAKRRRESRKQVIDYKYNPLDLICNLHNVKFIRYYYYMNEADRFRYSHGCPVCVGLIRAKVQLEFKRCSSHGKHRYPKNAYRSFNSNASTKRGRAKIQITTSTVSTGTEI